MSQGVREKISTFRVVLLNVLIAKLFPENGFKATKKIY
jgi:hypothetical protein